MKMQRRQVQKRTVYTGNVCKIVIKQMSSGQKFEKICKPNDYILFFVIHYYYT